jgi:hypothetical protein
MEAIVASLDFTTSLVKTVQFIYFVIYWSIFKFIVSVKGAMTSANMTLISIILRHCNTANAHCSHFPLSSTKQYDSSNSRLKF